MRGLVLASIVVSGCGFSIAGGASGGDDQPPPDASADASGADTAIDAPPAVPLRLFAASNQMLHALDLDAKAADLVGPIAEPGGASFDVDGLALYGATLIGVTPGGGELLTIDPATAAVTARTLLTPTGWWGGLTVAPAGDLGPTAIVFAGNGSDGKLYRIEPVTGVVTMVGSYGQGMQFFSDLAWVKGAGLFATLSGGACDSVCFARLDPTTGAATVFRSNLASNLFGLSGYRDQLWAFNSAGPVLSVNRTTGLLAVEFDPQIAWTEAAQ